MTQAGHVYLDNGNIENGIWSFENGYVLVTGISGDLVIRMTEKDFREVLSDFCMSDPKPKK